MAKKKRKAESIKITIATFSIFFATAVHTCMETAAKVGGSPMGNFLPDNKKVPFFKSNHFKLKRPI